MHLSASIAVLLRYMNVGSQIYQKYNWQLASTKLAICTVRLEGHRAGPRFPLHALHHYVLRVKIILADFNLVVSTAKFNSPSNFSAYGSSKVTPYLSGGRVHREKVKTRKLRLRRDVC